MKLTIKLFSILFIALTMNGLVNAAQKGAYVSGGLGYSELENFSDASVKSGNGLAGDIAVGYNFNHYIGLEARYTKYANATYTIDGYPGFTLDYKLSSASVLGKAYLPLNEKETINLYGLIGAASMFANGDLNYYGTSLTSLSRNALVAAFGLGLSYDITDHVSSSIEWISTNDKSGTSTEIGIPESNFLSLNIIYYLGKK